MKKLLFKLLILSTIGIVKTNETSHMLKTYPIISPYQTDYLAVSNLHQIFYEVYGNPTGIPVLVLHGGPGLGHNQAETRFFNPEKFKIVMFDQRGAMRSKPFACMQDNNTQTSIADIEALRQHLNIDKWLIFGGSWGSLLGILYGEAYPENCTGFILNSIFLGRPADICLFGPPEEVPAAYQEFIKLIPTNQQDNLLAATYELVMNQDPKVHLPIAKAMLRYHFIRTATGEPDYARLNNFLQNDMLVLSFARAVLHFASNQLFIMPNEALEKLYKISQIPAVIIHGNEDKNCAPTQAITLHQNWPKSRLEIIENTGHAYNDQMESAIIAATNHFANNI